MRGPYRAGLILAVLAVGVGVAVWLKPGRDVFASRAARRAYDGAPPVIPHVPFGLSCTECHKGQAIEVPGVGVAPSMPHGLTAEPGRFTNCRQCHVFIRDRGTFVASGFSGTAQRPLPGERAFAGAPPVMPHPLFLREDCLSCHSGRAARPEIICSHPERSRCLQCHAVRRTP